jgi:hypothetical protein
VPVPRAARTTSDRTMSFASMFATRRPSTSKTVPRVIAGPRELPVDVRRALQRLVVSQVPRRTGDSEDISPQRDGGGALVRVNSAGVVRWAARSSSQELARLL